MGLDFVELVMTLEREYNIKVLNQDLEHVRTVRQLWNVVATKAGLQPLESGPGWERFRGLVAHELGHPEDLVVAEADVFRDLHVD